MALLEVLSLLAPHHWKVFLKVVRSVSSPLFNVLHCSSSVLLAILKELGHLVLKVILKVVHSGERPLFIALRRGCGLAIAMLEGPSHLVLKVFLKVVHSGERPLFIAVRRGCNLALAILERLNLLVLKVLLEVAHPGANFLYNVLFPPGRREWVIMGSLKGIRVSAIPDTGSDLNIVSDHFIKRHGIKLDSESQRPIQLPNRKTNSTGAVSLPFSFEGEKSSFSMVFTVMPNCVHDVILSNSFLRTTETLTRFSSRLKSKFVPSLHTPRLRLLGAPKQRILGSINGRTVAALPDTGSDVILMSKHYAEELRLSLSISTEDAHRTCLEFADGTLANTYGIVFGVEWRFGKEDSTSRSCDFHIMDGLPYDVILSNDFLFESKAFSQFKDFFFEQREGLDLSRTFNELSLIKIVGPQNKAISRIHGFYRRFLQVVKGSESLLSNYITWI